MKPILFNTDMVRAILDGRKTVTRRVVKPQLEERTIPQETGCYTYRGIPCGLDGVTNFAPYRPGDILYMRETWAAWPRTEGTAPTIHYKANGKVLSGVKWHPSIHMPREAARIFLRVTEVRTERLQDITEDQAQAEGVKGWMIATDRDWDKNPNHRIAFRHAWNQTIKKGDFALYGWETNPWVWVIEFERVSREDAHP